MRNLKRALSLTLASVMLFGMMVVGTSAASYPDVSESDNVEAIEVLKAVGVMVGDEKGNFGPDQPVNRAQMAVVMALLLDLDYNYYEGTNTFVDVPAWAEPYVAACYANGIVSGYNTYTYGSGDSVTAVQAASMMMRALGYFKYQSDYDDNGGFELATVKQASKIGLFKDINANAKDPLTRNQVAKLALNTLE
ncbi:MAG: S-layer homology domain-containing protein, partial [Lawsonibacter sp.]|nr:S-layer homology domain-containing protein [Lawsonibacter sp.]